jgi:uncharacterized protein (TIGR02246 family)
MASGATSKQIDARLLVIVASRFGGKECQFCHVSGNYAYSDSLVVSHRILARRPYKGAGKMNSANEVVKIMCQRYRAAVNANDSDAYGKLFAEDAIRIPPGSEPEHGPTEIAQSEQKDYDVANWNIESRPLDALQIGGESIYGVAQVDVTTVAHDGGATKSFMATKTWLLQKQASGRWLIKRQMWNLK